jgi:hypothetical protein
MTVRQGQRRWGLSLPEVMLASVLMSMLLLAVYAAAEAIQRSSLMTASRLAPRQAIRSALNRFALVASGARTFYRGPVDGGALAIRGYSCRLPYVEEDGLTWHAGDSVAVAVPEDFTRPADIAQDPEDPETELVDLESAGAIADGFPDHVFRVVLLTTRPRVGPSRTPGARDLVVLRWDQVAPPIPGSPESIDLETLGNPSNELVFDAYLRPLDSQGFEVRYLMRDTTPVASAIDARFRSVPALGAVQQEDYSFLFTTRNI